jgi:hypothetical protein
VLCCRYKAKVPTKVQRARRASLADFNERMGSKPNDGTKRVGFGAQTDVAAVAYVGGGGGGKVCACILHSTHVHTHKRLARKRRRETILPSCFTHSLPATAVFSVLPVALSANSHVNCCCCGVVIHARVTTERQSASNGHNAERTTEQITAATWCCQEIHRALALLTGSATCYLPASGSGGVCRLLLVCLLRTRMYMRAHKCIVVLSFVCILCALFTTSMYHI